jgi:hypothetical protein
MAGGTAVLQMSPTEPASIRRRCAVVVVGVVGQICIPHGGLHLSHAPDAQTEFVMTLTLGKGAVTVRSPKNPTTLTVSHLDCGSQEVSAESDSRQVAKCLSLTGTRTRLTLRTATIAAVVTCVVDGGQRVLVVPVSSSAETAHALLVVAATDSPTRDATSDKGTPVSSRLLYLTPSTVNRL